jgi:peptidoglycan/LPS O-acetylase OafA/YrhL
MSESKSRFHFIDSIRGIAACIVMLQHSMEAGRVETLEKGHFALSFLNLGETGVLAFFLVSGFVIPFSLEKWDDVKHFWISRVFRIYPLYLFMYFVTLLVYHAKYEFSALGHLYNFAAHLLFIQEYLGQKDFVAGSWTLSLEAIWYLAFTCLFVSALNKKDAPIIAGTVALSLLAASLSLAQVARIPMGRVGFLDACVVGLLCYRYEQGSLVPKRFFGGVCLLLLVITLNLSVGFYFRPGTSMLAPTYRCVMLSWALGVAVFFVPFLTRGSSAWSNRLLTFVGKISYSIYLVHPILINMVSRLQLTGIPFVALVFVSAIPVSTLTYRFIEAPGIAFAHSLRKRTAAPA